MVEASDDRARCRPHTGLALDPPRGRRSPAGAGGPGRGARSLALEHPDRRLAARGGSASPGLRPAVAAQGDSPRRAATYRCTTRTRPSPKSARRRSAGARRCDGIDWYSFTLSFKGVFLEGLEVAFIVITFGTARENGVGIAAAAAGVALLVVVAAGALVHRPLGRVPENTLKFAVGLMLTTFGTFSGYRRRRYVVARGRRRAPSDPRLFLPRLFRRGEDAAAAARRGGEFARTARSRGMRYAVAFARFWYEFVVGDDWRILAGIAVAIAVTAALAGAGISSCGGSSRPRCRQPVPLVAACYPGSFIVTSMEFELLCPIPSCHRPAISLRDTGGPWHRRRVRSCEGPASRSLL